jgi:TRAP-type transport system periplasmic protein
MKNKLLLKLFVIIMASAVVLAGCAKSTSESGEEKAQNFELQFATFWPQVDFQVADGHEVWANEITERVANETPHTVKFKFHYSGALLAAPEIYEGVASGAADIGTTCPVYTMGVFPLTMGLELPGYNNDNALVATMTMQEAWESSPELQKEYEDVKVMFFWATGPGDFFTKTPVKTMEDLSNLQIRAAGGSALAIEALGGTPVSMPMSDAYVSLDSGIVDGLLGPTDTLKGFKLAEVTKYITKTPFVGYNVIFMKVMNKDTWNSLPPSVQKIFDEVNEKYIEEYGKLRTDNTILGQQYAVDEFGHEVFDLDEAEKEKWMEKIKGVADKWVSDTEAAGLPGEEIFELYHKIDDKYSELYKDYGK